MVSNARLDLPEPDSPVTTTRRSRGISSETFLRLCTRAPCTATVVRAVACGAALPFRFAAVEPIGWLPPVKERDLLDGNVAPLRELHRRRRLPDQPPVRQVLAGGGHAGHVEVPFEMVLDLRARPRLADVTQVVNHRREQPHRAGGDVTVGRVEG